MTTGSSLFWPCVTINFIVGDSVDQMYQPNTIQALPYRFHCYSALKWRLWTWTAAFPSFRPSTSCGVGGKTFSTRWPAETYSNADLATKKTYACDFCERLGTHIKAALKKHTHAIAQLNPPPLYNGELRTKLANEKKSNLLYEGVSFWWSWKCCRFKVLRAWL